MGPIGVCMARGAGGAGEARTRQLDLLLMPWISLVT